MNLFISIIFSQSFWFCLSISLAIVKKLQHIYHTAIKPLEEVYKYQELRQHEVSGKHLLALFKNYNQIYHHIVISNGIITLK